MSAFAGSRVVQFSCRRALQSTIAYIECQGTDAGTAITPLQDPNSRMNRFVQSGEMPFHTDAEAQDALRLLLGEEEA